MAEEEAPAPAADGAPGAEEAAVDTSAPLWVPHKHMPHTGLPLCYTAGEIDSLLQIGSSASSSSSASAAAGDGSGSLAAQLAPTEHLP